MGIVRVILHLSFCPVIYKLDEKMNAQIPDLMKI